MYDPEYWAGMAVAVLPGAVGALGIKLGVREEAGS